MPSIDFENLQDNFNEKIRSKIRAVQKYIQSQKKKGSDFERITKEDFIEYYRQEGSHEKAAAEAIAAIAFGEFLQHIIYLTTCYYMHSPKLVGFLRRLVETHKDEIFPPDHDPWVSQKNHNVLNRIYTINNAPDIVETIFETASSAFLEKHPEKLKKLLNSLASNESKDDTPSSPLDKACKAGNQKVVALLLKMGERAFAGNPAGFELFLKGSHEESPGPLHLIVHSGNIHIAEAFLSTTKAALHPAGLKRVIDQQDKNNLAPLAAAIDKNGPDMARLLYEHEASLTPTLRQKLQRCITQDPGRWAFFKTLFEKEKSASNTNHSAASNVEVTKTKEKAIGTDETGTTEKVLIEALTAQLKAMQATLDEMQKKIDDITSRAAQAEIRAARAENTAEAAKEAAEASRKNSERQQSLGPTAPGRQPLQQATAADPAQRTFPVMVQPSQHPMMPLGHYSALAWAAVNPAAAAAMARTPQLGYMPTNPQQPWPTMMTAASPQQQPNWRPGFAFASASSMPQQSRPMMAYGMEQSHQNMRNQNMQRQNQQPPAAQQMTQQLHYYPPQQSGPSSSFG